MIIANAAPASLSPGASASLRTLAVIPARLASTRLPRKPLHPLAGRPLLQWVWQRVNEMHLFDAVVIATDSEEIAAIMRAAGATVELTSAAHPSGTDRVAEVARRERYRDFQVIANVQGDEPFLRREQVEPALLAVRDAGWDAATVATPVGSLAEWRDPSVVKVVRDDAGAALYFSRAPVPYRRDGDPSAEELSGPRYLRHIGLYVYRRDALLRWVGLPEGELERIERLEQLRPLSAGIRIAVPLVAAAPGGVDTPADAERADALLRDELLHSGTPELA